jgi:Ca2+-binding EF-hand superfamily protein
MMTRTLNAAALLAVPLALLLALPAFAQDASPMKKKVDEKAAAKKRKEQGVSLFAARDKNRDGKLDPEVDDIPAAWLEVYDLDGSDQISKKEFTEIWNHPVLKSAHAMRHPRPRARNAMRQFDQDKNGLVDAKEYPGGETVMKRFDRNKDGALDRKELTKLAELELEGIRKKMKRANRYDFRQIFDLNYDGKISRKEYDGPTRTFAKFDKNNDGEVSYYELYPERQRDAERAAAEASRVKPKTMTVLKAMDTDDDGKVSRAEFKGTDAAWKRLDKNRDGQLSGADAH